MPRCTLLTVGCGGGLLRHKGINGMDPPIVELPAYFVFLFSKSHAQVYAKAGMTGGSAEEFCAFIAEKTGKEVLHIK